MQNILISAAPGGGDPRRLASAASILMDLPLNNAGAIPNAAARDVAEHAEAAESRQNRSAGRRQRIKNRQTLHGEFGSAAVTMAAERDVAFGSRAFAREVGRESLAAARTEQRMNFRETLRVQSQTEPPPPAPTVAPTTSKLSGQAESPTKAEASVGPPAASEVRPAETPSPTTPVAATGSTSKEQTAAAPTPPAPTTAPALSSGAPSANIASKTAVTQPITPPSTTSSATGRQGNTSSQQNANAIRPLTEATRAERTAPRPIAPREKPAESAEQRANIERLSRAILTRMRLDQGSFRMRLDPRELGEIRVEMHVRRDEVTVRILAETQMAQRLLEGEAETLREGLAGHGLRIERIDVQPLPEVPEGFGDGSFAGWDEARREGDAADRTVAERPWETSREARSSDEASLEDADSGDQKVLVAESRVNVWA